MRVFLLLLLCPLAAAAQTGKLAGRVVDDLGNPLPSANVFVEGTQLGAAADIDGEYRITGIPVGPHAITASFLGSFRTDTVEIRRDYTTQVNFELKANLATCELDSVYQTEDVSWVHKRLLPLIQPIAEAYGLEPLERKTSGPKEIRLWLFPAYFDKRLIRIVATSDSVWGSAGVGWSLRTSSADDAEEQAESLSRNRVYWRARQCEDIQSGLPAEACTFNLTPEPDWDSVLRKMEAASLWTLPDESVLPECRYGGVVYVTVDGDIFLFELFDGTSYRAFHYSNPLSSSPWPEERNAARIAEIVWDVFKLIPEYEP